MKYSKYRIVSLAIAAALASTFVHAQSPSEIKSMNDYCKRHVNLQPQASDWVESESQGMRTLSTTESAKNRVLNDLNACAASYFAKNPPKAS